MNKYNIGHGVKDSIRRGIKVQSGNRSFGIVYCNECSIPMSEHLSVKYTWPGIVCKECMKKRIKNAVGI